MSNQKLSQIVLHTNKSIDHCGLRVNIRNHFTRMMNHAVKSGNRKSMIFISGLVKQQLNQLSPLSHDDSIELWDKYIMSVICDHTMPFNTLADAYSKHDTGLELFDFYDDSANFYLNYSHRVIELMHQTALPTKVANATLHREAPELFYDNDLKTLAYASKDIKTTMKWSKTHEIPNLLSKASKDHQKEFFRSGLILNDTNNIMNRYLQGMNVITKDNSGYHLTTYGRHMMHSNCYRTIYHKILFNPLEVSHECESIFMGLNWIDQHPKYHQYFGLGLLIKLINFKNFKQVDNYNDPHSSSTVLGMRPYTYTCIILGTLIKYFVTNPNVLNQCMIRLEYTGFLIKSMFQFEKHNGYKIRRPYN